MKGKELVRLTKIEILEYLKVNRINHIIHDDSDGGEYLDSTTNYELLIGSQSCWLQVEEAEDFVVVQFYDDADNGVYSEQTDFSEPTSIVDEIEALIEHTKNKIKAEAKIESLVNKINDICNEYQLDMGDYITITSDNINLD
jgi:hypothetical protein